MDHFGRTLRECIIPFQVVIAKVVNCLANGPQKITGQSRQFGLVHSVVNRIAEWLPLE